MSRYLCHDQPQLSELETSVVDWRPGRVRLDRSPFYPGGGGQLADRGHLSWRNGDVSITGFEAEADGLWHLLSANDEIDGAIKVRIDQPFRELMSELHTLSHVVNNFVFEEFGGALVTGVQMAEDGSFRIDFDLPGADNDRLRGMVDEINDALRQDFPVRQEYLSEEAVGSEPGLIRSKAVTPPPQPDGTIRIVDIVGLDRQACGGTHLFHTGLARSIRILKVENKGRQNRRLRVGIADLFND
ncbi:alanyl-tRNA editing protein [Hoeflea poritis]|uniref:Alanyl-tRNA editing protein n=1 Tax=Hoeflea poritis TaxID=2993659 RepID=A0ABT4VKB8_9HYPH|nr:alanyl-tRNA editing protein [Hoeflea poritis]MDA4845126.1 alanyl-tRNA editing protein [Hoeflea poritis]